MIQVLSRHQEPKPSTYYRTYWYFAAERMALYYRRHAGEDGPWTADPIMQTYRFCNAYRLLDRTSQYLLREVIYSGTEEPAEVIFRTLLFKLFNKIETWEGLVMELGRMPSWQAFDLKRYQTALGEVAKRQPVYNAAYIMPDPAAGFGYERKFANHLALLEQMMQELPQALAEADSFGQVYRLLLSYPGIGPFLAYQYTTDLNYSEVIDFSENSFVVPGPGAKRGLAKCFNHLGDYTEPDAIKWLAERQEIEFERYELGFKPLYGRPLQLIDCQNLLCETDKYLRVAAPELITANGRQKIKQKFIAAEKVAMCFMPPKWR